MGASEYRQATYPLALGPGTVLGQRFEILRVIRGSSPFSITYFGVDARTRREVVIKEFLPRAFVSRPEGGPSVQPHSTEDERTFEKCLRRFVRETELLADLTHPALPRVVSCVMANGTAYHVAEYCYGAPLAELLAPGSAPIARDGAVAMVAELLDGLQSLHAEGILHGFVSPENVIVATGYKPMLTGFGTTRHVLGTVKPPVAGFAAIEQYAARDVGPWTDVYACGALLYNLLGGAAPASAVDRAAGRALTPLTVPALDPMGTLGRLVMRALCQAPEGRIHSAEEMRRHLVAAAAQQRGLEQQETMPEEQRPLDVIVPTGAGLRFEADPPQVEPSMFAALRVITSDVPAMSRSGRDRALALLRLPAARAAAGMAALLLVAAAITVYGDAGAVAARAGGMDDPPAVAVAGAPRAAPSGPARAVPQLFPQRDSVAHGGDVIAVPPAATGVAAQPRVSEPETAETPPEVAPRPVTVDRSVRVPAVGTAGVPVTVASVVPLPVLPFERMAALREQVAQGVVKSEYGDYPAAQKLFAAALDSVTQLAGARPGEQGLAALRGEIEQAMARTRRACEAENVVLRARGAGGIRCD